MTQNSWLNEPAFRNMHPLKLKVLIDLTKEAAGKPLSQTIPYILKAQQTLKASNLSFSKEESALLIEILTKDMSLEEYFDPSNLAVLSSAHGNTLDDIKDFVEEICNN